MCSTLVSSMHKVFLFCFHMQIFIRELKITTTATATGASLNKRFNEQNNGSARAL